ncbi:MAG: glutathione S-transferase family protein [Betaproteobacteria bacterium]|nr:glutathione S-transferase family protein [Betaproteobacteria bacterium]
MKSDLQPKPVTLYTYVMSPYAAKVHCFLLYKHMSFECFYINPLRLKQDLPVGRQIPVVTIGGESRADSTPIGLWLDERFPDLPRLLPESGDERALLLKIDDWITNRLIPGSFRFFPGEGLDRWLNGWKLSFLMDKTAQGGLPGLLRAAWPFFIKRVAFIRRLLVMAEDGLSMRESKRRLYRQFISHLNGGPFLAGRSAPSLPDLAAYPQFALFYLTGFRGSEDILESPEIMSWLKRMEPYVCGTPPLVPAVVRMRELP